MSFWFNVGVTDITDTRFKADQFMGVGGDILNYRLYIPETYDVHKSYPVVLFFHGAGERGSDNNSQLRWGVQQFALDSLQARHPSIILAPQCPSNSWWTSNHNWRNEGLILNSEPVTTLQVSVDLLKQVQEEYSIDQTRLYVTGISMGGFATWAAIMHYPNLFAAAVPVCGGGDSTRAHLIRDIPIWNFHGAKDNVVPPELSREMIQALQEAGGRPGYTEYPDVEHNSWIPAYREPFLYEWLFEQRRKN